METTAGRLLRLLGMLQARQDWTADEIAQRLEVTPRTVRRDIVRLRRLGYPVEAFAGPGGGYRLGAGGKLPPLLLDDDEAVAVALRLRTAAGETAGGLEEAAVSALAKIEQVLPPPLRSRLSDIAASIVHLPPFGPVATEPSTIRALAEAARSQVRTRFHYVTGDGREGERLCEPFRLVFTHRRWYLVAYDCDRRDWRTFRVDRISRPHLTGMRFQRREPPDAVALVEEGMALAPYRWRAEVVLGVPPTVARQYVPATVGRLEERDGETCLLVIGGDELDWIARYLAGLPVPFRVESPPELGDALADLGRRLLASAPGTV